jgi:hypothetical protein
MSDILDQMTVADMLAMSSGRKVAVLHDVKGKRRAAARRPRR